MLGVLFSCFLFLLARQPIVSEVMKTVELGLSRGSTPAPEGVQRQNYGGGSDERRRQFCEFLERDFL